MSVQQNQKGMNPTNLNTYVGAIEEKFESSFLQAQITYKQDNKIDWL